MGRRTLLGGEGEAGDELMKPRWAAQPWCMRPESSYDEGWVGGDSPIKLIRFPGEPARPPLVHSLVMLGAVLADTDVVERASNKGEAAGLTW